MTRLAPSPALPSAPAPARPRWWWEIGVMGALYLLYDGIRLVVAAGRSEAFTNAHRVLDFERALHINHEEAINHLVSARPVFAVTMCYAYATMHYLVTPVVLVWLWRRRPDRYARARTTLVAGTLIGLLGFWLFPTAPPRMVGGFVDTLAQYASWGWWGTDASAPQGLGSLTNEFAAMPSLHVGWAAWCGWQIFRGTSWVWLRVLGVIYPCWIYVVVIGTGNHYMADAAAGLAVIGLGVAIARLTPRLASFPRLPGVPHR